MFFWGRYPFYGVYVDGVVYRSACAGHDVSVFDSVGSERYGTLGAGFVFRVVGDVASLFHSWGLFSGLFFVGGAVFDRHLRFVVFRVV